MTRLRFLVLSVTVPLVCATDIELGEGDVPGGDPRYLLEAYVREVTVLIDSQIEALAKVLPEEEVGRLRADYYAWKSHRDISCAEAARYSLDDLHELECLSRLSEEHLQEREAQLAEIEAKQTPTPRPE